MIEINRGRTQAADNRTRVEDPRVTAAVDVEGARTGGDLPEIDASVARIYGGDSVVVEV